MNFKQHSYRLVVLTSAVLAIIAFALQILTYWNDLNPSNGFFRNSAIACKLSNGIGFFCFFASLFLSHRKTKFPDTPPAEEKKQFADTPPSQERETFFENKIEDDSVFLSDTEEESPPPSFKAEKERIHQKEPAHVSEFAQTAVTWQGTLSAFATFFLGFGFLAFAFSLLTEPDSILSPDRLLFAFCSFLSGAYTVFSAMTNSSLRSKIRPFFALAPALWCTVRLVVEYRDLSRFVNKTLYVGQFLFLISATVFFLYQAQQFFGEKTFLAENAYAYSALSTLFFGFSARLARVISIVFHRIQTDFTVISVLAMDLAITLYAAVKVLALISNRKSEK